MYSLALLNIITVSIVCQLTLYKINLCACHTSLYIVLIASGQEPGMEIIDMSVIDGALNYVLRNQRKTGELPIVGRVHSFNLFVSSKLHTKHIYVLLLSCSDQEGPCLTLHLVLWLSSNMSKLSLALPIE